VKQYISTFFIFCIISTQTIAQCLQPVQADYHVLMDLYYNNNGPNWTNNSGWILGEIGNDCNPCNWHGIWCENDRVVELNLTNNNVKGELLNYIEAIEKLKYLIAPDNLISGDIPDFIFVKESLIAINLSNNNLNSSIPLNAELHENVYLLNLASTNLSGKIPTNFFRTSNLTRLNLSNNNLTGQIPNNIADTQNMQELNLSNNQITGPIPIIFSTEINLSNNNLTGTIPKLLCSQLNLSNNNLTGQIPKLYAFGVDLSNNNLSGCYDCSICELYEDNFASIDVSNNPNLPFANDLDFYCEEYTCDNSQFGLPCGIDLNSTIQFNCKCVIGGLKVTELSELVEIYPNPVMYKLYVEPRDIISFRFNTSIINIQGEVFQTNIIIDDKNNIEINVTDLQAGIYYLIAENETGILSYKFLKM